MGYAVDTSEAFTEEGCRKRFFSQKETADGVEFTVKQRKHQPLKSFIGLVIVLALIGWGIYSIVEANKRDGFLFFLFILGMIFMAVLGLAAAYISVIAASYSLFAKGTSRFIVNSEGVVLLSGGGRLRKKLLPWEHVSELWAQDGRNGGVTVGNDTDMVYVASGGIGAIGVGAAMGVQAVGDGAANSVREMFATMRAFVAIKYKNREIKLASILNYPEALVLLRSIETAQNHRPAA